MKADGRVQLQIYSFLTPAPDGGGWSASGADNSTPHPPKPPSTIRRLRGSAELAWRCEREEKWPGIDPRFHGRSARIPVNIPTMLSRLPLVERQQAFLLMLNSTFQYILRVSRHFNNTERTHQNRYAVIMDIQILMTCSCTHRSIYCCTDCHAFCTIQRSKSTSLRSIPIAFPPKPEPGWGRPWQSSFPVPATKSVCPSTDANIKIPPQWVVTFPCPKWIRAIRLSSVFLYFLLPFLHPSFIPQSLLSFGAYAKLRNMW